MTLLDDLRALDIESITSARVSISASVSGPDIQAIVDGGAVVSALGDVGAMVTRLTEALEDPESLFAPLAEALLSVAGDLDGIVGAGSLPLDDYLRAVTEGVALVTSLFDGIDDDPLALLRFAGRALPDVLGEMPGRVTEAVAESVEQAGVFASLLARVDDGVPTDVAGLLDLSFEVLAPFPRDVLDGLRARIDALFAATGTLALPTTRTQGLVLRLDAVATAAATGDAAAVTSALAELERVRAQTVDVIRADLSVVASAVGSLPIADVAAAVESAHLTIVRAESGLLDLVQEWRGYVAAIRASVEDLDGTKLAAMLRAIVEIAEAYLRANVVVPIEAAVDRAVAWVTATMGSLPVRPLRAEITAAIHVAATAVREAGLDAPARAVRGVLADVGEALDTGVAEQVQAAVATVRETLDTAVGGVLDGLAAVESGVNAVKEQAEAVLLPAAEVVTSFTAAIEDVTVAVEALDLVTPAQQVVDRVSEIRVVVEEVLANVPLPEPLRPLVEQLVDQLDALRLESTDLRQIPVLEPVLNVVEQFGGGITAGVEEGMTALRDVLRDVIPTELVASIEAEVRAALDVVASFDPMSLVAGVSDVVSSASEAVAGIDLDAAVAPVRAPFQAVLDLWDRARPSTLLAPAAAAYDGALAQLSIPGAESLARAVGGAFGAAGDQMGAALVAPLARLGPEGTTVAAAPGTGAGAGGAAPPAGGGASGAGGGAGTGGGSAGAGGGGGGSAGAEAELPVRPGDLVRLLGFLPAKLREALAALGSAGLNQVLAGVDRMTSRLAADLRAAATEVARVEGALDVSLDELCAPLAAAQGRAQLAVAASFGLSAGGASVSLDLDATFDGLAGCGAGSLRADLDGAMSEVRGRVRGAAGRHSSVAVALNEMADAIDACALARLAGDADAFLAALDPEPIAEEIDALAGAVLAQLPEYVAAIRDDVDASIARLGALLGELSPGVQMMKFRAVLSALRAELDVLDPALLAAELDEVHAAVRATLEAYDPALLAQDVEAMLATVAAQIEALDPETLLGDLDPLGEIVAAATAANPATALAEVVAEMSAIADAFAGVDLDAVTQVVTELPQQVFEAFAVVLESIRREIKALLESLRYASGGVSVSVSAEVHA